LDYGFIPALGISAWWTIFVLGIHTVWSTAVPIALVESLTPEARHTPWLGPWGLVITTVIFLLGCAMTFFFQLGADPFFATTMQFVVSGVVVVLLVLIAFALGQWQGAPQDDSHSPPAMRTVGSVLFLLGSAFMTLALFHDLMPAFVIVPAMLAVLAGGSWLLWHWSRRAGWSAAHELAAASGLLLTYAWYGFVQIPSVGGTTPVVDTIGNAVFATGAIILLVVAWRRITVPHEAAPAVWAKNAPGEERTPHRACDGYITCSELPQPLWHRRGCRARVHCNQC
jgi:hypothetical protein